MNPWPVTTTHAGNLPRVTQLQAQRMQLLLEMGCVACRREAVIQLKQRLATTAEVHYLLLEGKPIGHWDTIALCGWHRRGEAPFGTPHAVCRQRRGPSLAIESEAFRNRYGSDVELLARQNKTLLAYCLHMGMHEYREKLKRHMPGVKDE